MECMLVKEPPKTLRMTNCLFKEIMMRSVNDGNTFLRNDFKLLYLPLALCPISRLVTLSITASL